MSPPPTSPSAPVAEEYRWFADEVQPCAASLKAYVHAAFPAIQDVDDVVQESFLRIWKARATQRIESAKAFLFTIAWRVAADGVRRRQSCPVDSIGCLDGLAVVTDEPHVADVIGRRERANLLGQAVASLPARCREIFIRHKIRGHSRKEVAAQLGISERTIETQTARAMKHCGEYLRRRAALPTLNHARR